jgi:hypothetical protein
VIDVIIVDILEAYGLILSRDWSAKLNGYFATDWSHLWLPFKGNPNKIKVDCERYMKHTVTDLNDANEPVMFNHFILGNFCFETFFGELEAETSTFTNSNEQPELLQITQTDEPHYTILEDCTKEDTNNSSIVPIPCGFALELTDPSIWTLYFDGSKNKEGAGVGCLLIDPHGSKMMITCRLEFECTNNVAKYEALVQGLRKALDLNIKCI